MKWSICNTSVLYEVDKNITVYCYLHTNFLLFTNLFCTIPEWHMQKAALAHDLVNQVNQEHQEL